MRLPLAICPLIGLLVGLILVVVDLTAEPARQRSLLRSTVRITCGGVRGSGTIISSDATGTIILTANHVVSGGGDLSVEVFHWTTDGDDTFSSTTIPAEILRLDAAFDLATLHLPPSAGILPTVPLLDSRDPLARGAPVLLVGCPAGLDPILTAGEILDPFLCPSPGPYIRFLASAPTWFGNSGGGGFIKVGGTYYLLGVSSVLYGPASHLAGHVHPSAIRSFLSQ